MDKEKKKKKRRENRNYQYQKWKHGYNLKTPKTLRDNRKNIIDNSTYKFDNSDEMD